MKPSVGRVVHYVSHGTPPRPDGSQAFAQRCRAAIVSEVGDDDRIGLVAINPTGLFFHSLADGGCKYADPAAETAGDPDCAAKGKHGSPFRYCACGWSEASFVGGTWHWPERVDG